MRSPSSSSTGAWTSSLTSRRPAGFSSSRACRPRGPRRYRRPRSSLAARTRAGGPARSTSARGRSGVRGDPSPRASIPRNSTPKESHAARHSPRHRFPAAQPEAARPGDVARARRRTLPRGRRVGRRRAARPGGLEALRLAAPLYHPPPLGSHDRPGAPPDHALDRRPERAARDLGAGGGAPASRPAARLPRVGHRGAPRPHARPEAARGPRDGDRGGQGDGGRRRQGERVPRRARPGEACVRLPLRGRRAQRRRLRRHAAVREPRALGAQGRLPHPRMLRDGEDVVVPRLRLADDRGQDQGPRLVPHPARSDRLGGGRGAREGARDDSPVSRVRPGGALRRRPKALRRARRRRRRPDGGVMPIGPTPTSGLRVLVVDDEPGIRRLIQTSLKGWGYEVVAASTGEEALAILESDAAPSLAILDWTMPGMDGLELCRRVRGLPKPIKPYLIFVTARARTQDIVTGLTAGADDYIVKPFQRDELHARVRVGERLLGLQATLADRVKELEDALARVKLLQGLLPICSYCKKVRDDQNYWQQVESYIEGHSEAQFTHGICPECRTKYVEPELERLRQQRLSGE